MANRQSKEGYLATRVATTDGRIVVGHKVKESAGGIELRDPYTRQLLGVTRAEIEEMNDVGSLMPEGLTAAMRREEVRDLIRFLDDLGRSPTKWDPGRSVRFTHRADVPGRGLGTGTCPDA